MATGMMALRMRCEERKRIVRYDYCMYNSTELKQLEHCLKYFKVRYWFYDGFIYSYDVEKFDRALNCLLNGE